MSIIIFVGQSCLLMFVHGMHTLSSTPHKFVSKFTLANYCFTKDLCLFKQPGTECSMSLESVRGDLEKVWVCPFVTLPRLPTLLLTVRKKVAYQLNGLDVLCKKMKRNIHKIYIFLNFKQNFLKKGVCKVIAVLERNWMTKVLEFRARCWNLCEMSFYFNCILQGIGRDFQ